MLTIFVGPNAIGKTNVVESIQLLTALSSFRNPTVEQLIRKNGSHAFAKSFVSDGNRELELSLHLEGHSKKYHLNGKAKRSADLKGVIPSVTFTPDDLELVKGSMSVRRQAFDTLGSQLNANYHLIRKDYEKVVRHKNRLLKEEVSPLMLDSIDEMLITCGAQLSCYRSALFARLLPHMKRLYEEISQGGDSFSASYTHSWNRAEGEGEGKAFSQELEDPNDLDQSPAALTFPLETEQYSRDEVRDLLQEALQARRRDEIVRKRCLVGPHLDKIHFFVNDMDATHFASQGQQRSIVLAERLAEAAVIEEMLGQKPVLLLDDVMSELDGARREALLAYISQDVQTFITTANIAYFGEDMLERADVIHLERDDQGRVVPVRKAHAPHLGDGEAGFSGEQ